MTAAIVTQPLERMVPAMIAPTNMPFRNLSTPVRHSWELIREQSPVS